MSIGELVLRAVAAGLLVIVFALIGEVFKPKAFSGLFAAAPSVAVASLAVTLGFQGPARALAEVAGMAIGGVAMTACCVVAVAAIPRFRAVAGSLLAWVAWSVVGLGLYWAVFVGAR